jgi:peptidoglycan/LPS O-acetylase OafA/YrhL
MAELSSRKILGFNGLRGCCVILVYLSHKCELRYYTAQMGVWTFLALSGFLIIGELHKQRLEVEADACGIVTGLRIFFTKRAIRIFPAYYGVLAVLFAFQHFYAWVGPDLGFRYHFLYLSNVWFGYFAPWLGGPFGVLWTLSVEQQFYVVAPFAFILSPSRFHVRICLGAAALAAIGHLWMQVAGVNPTGIYMTSPWNLAIIALGGAAGLLTQKPRFANAMRGPLPLGICLAAATAYAASWAVYRTENPEQALPLFGVTFALVGLVAWVKNNQDSMIVRGLEWKPLEHLGVISYGFYLIHNFVPNPLGKVLPLYFGITVTPMTTLTLGAAIGFAISFTLAHLSWTYYERPLLKLRTKLLPKRYQLSNRWPNDDASEGGGGKHKAVA